MDNFTTFTLTFQIIHVQHQHNPSHHLLWCTCALHPQQLLEGSGNTPSKRESSTLRLEFLNQPSPDWLNAPSQTGPPLLTNPEVPTPQSRSEDYEPEPSLRQLILQVNQSSSGGQSKKRIALKRLPGTGGMMWMQAKGKRFTNCEYIQQCL